MNPPSLFAEIALTDDDEVILAGFARVKGEIELLALRIANGFKHREFVSMVSVQDGGGPPPLREMLLRAGRTGAG